MDVQMQKYRIARWVGRLLAVLSLVTSYGAHAAVLDAVQPDWKWCYFQWSNCVYSTDMEAAQAYSANSRAGYDQYPANPYQSEYPHLGYVTVESCDGNGVCHGTSTFPKSVRHPYFSQQPFDYTFHKQPVCRAPTTYPTIPYQLILGGIPGSPPGLDCIRFIPSALTIALSGSTEVEPSNGSNIRTLPIIATVIDQNTQQPTTNAVQVHISLKVEDPKSGGHDHGDSTRPRGGIATVKTCASDGECWTNPTVNGVVEFNFRAPEASGKYTITAGCDGCSNTAAKPVNVKVNGLEPIPAFPYYALEESDPDNPGQTKVIGATDLHGKNHNLTHAAAQRLMMIAIQYRIHPKFRVLDKKTKTKVPPPPLHVNDASLELGGKFDIKGTWTGSHAEHRRGTSVDLRANENAGAIPPELFEEFEQLLGEIIAGDAVEDKFIRECTPNEKPSTSNPNPVQHNRTRENYCVSQVDGSFDTNRHYHVRLLGE